VANSRRPIRGGRSIHRCPTRRFKAPMPCRSIIRLISIFDRQVISAWMVPVAPFTVSQPKFRFANLWDAQRAHDSVVEFFSSTNVSDRDGNMVKHMLTLPDACEATSVLCTPSAVRQQSNAGPTLPLVGLVGKSLGGLCSYTGLKDAWAVARLASSVLTPIHRVAQKLRRRGACANPFEPKEGQSVRSFIPAHPR